MISKDSLRKILTQIAYNNNLTGDSVSLLVDELVYAIYHEQVEITNAIQENNLSTASLLNSKIRSCMNVMYPVYRGRNARVKLMLKTKIKQTFNKYDLIYNSNSFKVYAEDAVSLSSTNNESTPVIGILSKGLMYDKEFTINDNNRYYLDFKIDGVPVEDLSEDLIVTVNDEVYETTRNFFDFTNQAVKLKELDAYRIDSNSADGYYVLENGQWIQESEWNDDWSLKGNITDITQLPSPELNSKITEKLFILTLPNYGIRVYKRGYFDNSDTVRVRVLNYTTKADINESEYNKILPFGTVLDPKLSDINSPVSRRDSKSGFINEISRDNEKSLLQSANYYERLQGQMMSKSDINLLFTEYFFESVQSAINWYDQDNGVINVIYVPREGADAILINSNNSSTKTFDKFVSLYGSYFISMNMSLYQAVKYEVQLKIDAYCKDPSQNIIINDKIKSILSNYEYVMNSPTKWGTDWDNIQNNTSTNIYNPNLVFGSISKIPEIEYISELTYRNAYEVPGWNGNFPPLYIEDNEVKIPTYYVFNVTLTLHQIYEIVS